MKTVFSAIIQAGQGGRAITRRLRSPAPLPTDPPVGAIGWQYNRSASGLSNNRVRREFERGHRVEPGGNRRTQLPPTWSVQVRQS
jgi:hypothetical protein